MIDTSTPATGGGQAAGGPIEAATMDMARSVLMGVGTPLLAHGWVTGSQWQAMVGGAIALASAVWSYVAAHPAKTNPLQAVQGLVKAGGQAPQWDSALARLEPLLVKMAEKGASVAIRARAGVLAGPLDAVADKAVQAAADTAVGHLEI